MRILYHGFLCAALYVLMLACLGGLSGCGDGKPSDGGMIVNEAKPLTDEQKAARRKFYPDRSKNAAKKGGPS